MKLRTQVLFAISALMFLILMIGCVVTYARAVSKVDAEMSAAIEVGSRIAHNAVDDVEEAADPKRRIELLVADFNGDRHVQAVLINGPGAVAMSSVLLEPEVAVPGWFIRLFGGPPRSAHVKLPAAFDGLGDFVLRADSSNEVAELWNEVNSTLGLLLSFCALTLAVMHFLLGRALEPLEKLSEALAKVGVSGDVERIAERGPSELVSVYSGFNRMVERLHQVEQHNRRLNEQLATVQEEERSDIARDLHDEIGPFLFAVDVDAVAIQKALSRNDIDFVGPRIALVREAVGHMSKHVKSILARLRPGALLDLGFPQAVDGLVAFWRGRNPSIVFDVSVAAALAPPHDEIAYRVIQEGLSNAVRHGKPGRIRISVEEREGGEISIRIEDDGAGVGGGSNGGYGLLGMRERLTSIGGTLDIQPGGTGGTSLVAMLPGEARKIQHPPKPDTRRIAAE